MNNTQISNKAIPKSVRKDISDLIDHKKIHWSGCLEDIDFLSRLYDLSKLQSFDPRYKCAEEDIRQHTYYNDDYPRNWVYTDSRFKLLETDEVSYLNFLQEMMHFQVNNDRDRDTIRNICNDLLARYGYQFISKEMGGVASYKWNLQQQEHYWNLSY